MDKSSVSNFADCFTFSHLMRAANICASGVNWKHQVQQFMEHRLTYCAKLYHELHDGTYKPSKSQQFCVVERGKARHIKSVNFRDRVVQRCLCDHVLVPLIEQTVIEDNSACLKGRGLDYAFDRVRAFLSKCPIDGWVLQFDFSNYFATIDQGKLLGILRKLVDDDQTYRVIETIIRDDKQGLELGSHVSQICAVLYPDELDRAMLYTDGLVGYHRYMDDGLDAYDTKEHASAALDVLKLYVEAMGLKLNAKKTHVNRATHPIVFCKRRFRKKAGGVRVTLRKKQTRRTIRHTRAVLRRSESVYIDIEPALASIEGHLRSGDADLTRLIDTI